MKQSVEERADAFHERLTARATHLGEFSSEYHPPLLLDDLPVGFALYDPTGAYLDASDGLCGMLGYRREELIGRYPAEIGFTLSEISHMLDARGKMLTLQLTPEILKIRLSTSSTGARIAMMGWRPCKGPESPDEALKATPHILGGRAL